MACLNHWIPACAGMTTSREKVGCHPHNSSAIPEKCLTATLRHSGEGRNPGNGGQNAKRNPAYACLLQTDQSHTLQ